jgi:hypothetical protein
LNISRDLIDSPLTHGLKTPVSTVTNFQRIKFVEGQEPGEVWGQEFMGITHKGCLTVGKTCVQVVLCKK